MQEMPCLNFRYAGFRTELYASIFYLTHICSCASCLHSDTTILAAYLSKKCTLSAENNYSSRMNKFTDPVAEDQHSSETKDMISRRCQAI